MQRGTLGVVGLIAGMALGGVSVGLAAIPDSNTGVISACLTTRNGSIRVIDHQSGRRCGNGEVLLTWNQIGPTGVAGPQGNPGATGPAGADGATGDTGPAGPGASVLGIVNDARSEPETEGLWSLLDGATVTVPSEPFARTASITFWASAACFGTGAKYARLLVDDVVVSSAPLAPVPNEGFSEMQSSIVHALAISAESSPVISIQVQTAPSTYCVIIEGLWSLTAIVSPTS